MKLWYVNTGMPGFTRVQKGKDFIYLDNDGNPVKDEAVLDRIRKLVLPPAWEEVWICPWPNGHLQATGIDAKGRKQYRYHTAWGQMRNETKYYRLRQFGENLPGIRKRIHEDLKHPSLDKHKVIAIALSVMEETLIRVGNASYNAFNLLADLAPFESVTECHRNIVAIIDGVAGKLGNTRAVCKKYYIHPQLLISYENGELEPWLQQLRSKRNKPAGGGLHADEKVLLQFLKDA